MPRVLIIPDVHLKTKIFKRAAKIMRSGQADFAVMLGDLVDDWGEEFNLPLYDRTMKAAIEFVKEFPNTIWVIGNHDFGYLRPEYGKRCSGHSVLAEANMARSIGELSAKTVPKVAVIIDHVMFSHGGVLKSWADQQTQRLGMPPAEAEMLAEVFVRIVNGAPAFELWLENSPLWARPQGSKQELYGSGKFLQVVGHTPAEKITLENGLLSTDVFSTYSNGAPIGEQKFAIVDTEKQTWGYAKEEYD